MTILDRVKGLCDERGISINDLEDALEFSRNTLYRLKKQTPGGDKLKIIADYLDTSTDYLLGRTDRRTWEIAKQENNYWNITDKDYIDIAVRVDRIITGLESDNDFNFYGKTMSQLQKERLIVALKMALELSKE